MRVPAQDLIEQLRRVAVLDDTSAEGVRRRLAEDPSLLVAEAVRDEIGLRGEGFQHLLCQEFGSEYLDTAMLEKWPIQPAAIEYMPMQRAQDLAVFPLSWDASRGRLLLVTAYPINPHVLADLESAFEDIDVEMAFTDEKALLSLQKRGYIGRDDSMADLAGEDGFEIGAASDEDAFPGIYGGNISDYLYGESDEETDAAAEESDEGVRGNLLDMSVMELLQPLGQNRKTCSVFFESHDKRAAAVYLQDGMVIHAECGDLLGEDAVYEVLHWDRGHFEILRRGYPGSPSMLATVEGLLLEGVRRIDEAGR